jgi:diguanylate cyclase (GGDEF)-like protein
MFTPEGIATVGQLMAKRRAAETAASPMGSVTFEAQHRCKDGRLLWAEVQSKPERDASGRITGFHGITREITEKKALQDQVRQLAFFDPLTTLANRRLLGEHLGQALTAARRNQRCGALLFLDLDNFKPLNDTHGHDVGDLLLVEAARRLKTCVRESDTVARFGGDEFVVLLNQLHAEPAEAAGQAAMVAEKVRATLSEAYHLTVMRPGEEGVAVSHLCTASVGLAVFTGGPATPEEVMKGADAAMYEAKAAGRNQVRVHGGASRAPFPARGPSLPV